LDFVLSQQRLHPRAIQASGRSFLVGSIAVRSSPPQQDDGRKAFHQAPPGLGAALAAKLPAVFLREARTAARFLG
jgi:hypothetical protein